MKPTARERLHVVALWLGAAALRWLAALPITQPRIFRDELLHWQLARSFVTHRPFLVQGQVVDYPAVLYPALLSLGLHGTDLHAAFHLAQGFNALMASAVVLAAYALGRELTTHRDALVVAALAALVPGGVYSAFIMEESLYFPLFVTSCWLGWRVLTYGRAGDAAWCAVALGLTYFAKPLVVPLVAGYAAVAVLWGIVERRSSERDARSLLGAMALRLAPVAAFGAMLLLRHALTSRGADESQSGAVLGRFYADELGGALVPPLKPFSAVVLSLSTAILLGVGVAPLVALLGGWRARVADRRRLWLAALAVVVAAVYVLAAARHNMVINRSAKIHERYVFAVAPLFLALFVAEGAAIGVASIVVACVGLVLVVARIADTMLPENTWPNAPSLTLAWLVHLRLSSNLVLGVIIGAAAAVVCWTARRPDRWRGALRPAAVGLSMLVLDGVWYAFVASSQRFVAPVAASVQRLEMLPPGSRITTVVASDADPMAALSYWGKFWLEDRLTIYWTGATTPPWYVDSVGVAVDAARRTGAAYLVGLPGVEAACTGGTPVASLPAGPSAPVRLIAVPAEGCDAGAAAQSAPR